MTVVASLQAERKRGPRFPAGIVISEESLVVDLDGNAWWVRPGSMTIVPASPSQHSSEAANG